MSTQTKYHSVMNEQDNLRPSSDLYQQILAALEKRPGLKAREIATQLDIDKQHINNALYGSIRDKCTQDDKYCWYLNKDAPDSDNNKKTAISKTALANISRYYLACLGQEDEKGISVFADSKYDLDYVELNTLPHANSDNLFRTKGAENLFGRIRKDRGRMEMYFGYPITLKKVKSKKSNWEGFFVEPILLFPIEINNGNPKISHGFPIFNLSVLQRFTNIEREQLIDELVQLEEELNLHSEDEIPELDDLVQKLNNIRPEWPWKEPINPDELPTDPPIRNISEAGIYNRAVLIVGTRSPFTQGLESELKSLAEVKTGVYQNTALGQWIKGEINKKERNESLPLLEVLPLNSEQRQAILHSLENPLTIITGPPGTGKSQVVTNLLINATWQGKKVLFASKNNKAVDVVEIRINNLSKRPILLRTGSGQHNAKLAEYLMGLLTSTSSEYDQEEFDIDKQRYKRIEELFFQLDEKEMALTRLRNETDELDQSVEKIRKDVSPQAFGQLKNINPQLFQGAIGLFQKSLSRANKDEQGFVVSMFWNFLKNKRYENLRLEVENIQSIVSKLELNSPTQSVSDETIQNWIDFSKTLDTYLHFAQTIQEYISSLKSLQATTPLEQISKEKVSLIKDMAASAESLWKGWLRLQPNRLSDEDRNLLSNYNALLKMVIDAGSDLYVKLGKNIYREYSNISKNVSHLLPAWAITSLSARGRIPFDAGYFDIVVFDEASQCDIASALPLLYRAKQAVVIGDPKQLRHISGLQRGQDQQFLEKYDLIPEYARWAYSYNSLFDLASGLVSKNDIINLRDHHRSHSEIIEFSNQEFYEGNLRVATNYNRLKFVDSEKSGIRWVNVIGAVQQPPGGGAVNEIEATSVVKEIDKLVNEKSYKGSIGVVTPFRAQANLIRKIVTDNSALQRKLINHDFLVDTVHKFQGDERDVMIFSSVVSRNMPEGALGFMRNNGNLFNVAITRARALLLVVGDQNMAIKCKVSYLENFAKYTQQLESTTEKKISRSRLELGEKYPTVTHPERVSEWEHVLYEALYNAGIKAIPQYQIEKYTLDFALFYKDRNLDIEVDGERYHKNWTGELCRRDQIRNQRLFELGWDVKRFWVYEIRDDIYGCVEKIKQWMDV